MKKIAVWNYYESLNEKNYFLLNKNTGIGDDLLEPTNRLYNKGKINNIDFMTPDMIDNFNTIEGVIFFDFPRLDNEYVQKIFQLKIPKYLVLFETELIKLNNWDLNKHKYFNKIFTWNDDFIDNTKYFKINFSYKIPSTINKTLTNKKKLCTLIAGYKFNRHKLELYSKRIEAIRWFEKNHLQDFDLYGIGWDKFTSINKYTNYIVKKLKLTTLLAPRYKSYKGKVDRKKDTLEKYKFSICYENAKDIPGYITEKIFDCFFAGCVPIYWGANNITDHIPKECFIDKREFKTYQELYDFIYSMNDEKYLEYLENIEIFLNSDKSYQFSSEYFVEQIINNIC